MPERSPKKGCSVLGCTKTHYSNSFCLKHYKQIARHGHILERTRYDPPEIREVDGSIYVGVYSDDGRLLEYAIFDPYTYSIIKNMKLSLARVGYVVTRINGKVQYIHRIITNPPEEMYVDHINHNKLDNRLCNLRVCTNAENCWNRDIRGVSKTKSGKKWTASIIKNKQRYYLGTFPTEEEALLARKQAEARLYGEFFYRKESEKEGI